ncbi:hypothetical protein E5D57_010151 [Metarhizium anisopliae]|nr:hypothetical protein E5D57_010151 [Metarhizium anisopliae]
MSLHVQMPLALPSPEREALLCEVSGASRAETGLHVLSCLLPMSSTLAVHLSKATFSAAPTTHDFISRILNCTYGSNTASKISPATDPNAWRA